MYHVSHMKQLSRFLMKNLCQRFRDLVYTICENRSLRSCGSDYFLFPLLMDHLWDPRHLIAKTLIRKSTRLYFYTLLAEGISPLFVWEGSKVVSINEWKKNFGDLLEKLTSFSVYSARTINSDPSPIYCIYPKVLACSFYWHLMCKKIVSALKTMQARTKLYGAVSSDSTPFTQVFVSIILVFAADVET